MPNTSQQHEPWVPQAYFDYAPSALVRKQETKSHQEKPCPVRERKPSPGYVEWEKRVRPLERQIQPATDVEVAFRHSGWSATRSKVERALERIAAPDARRERFRHCGSGCMVQRQVGTERLRLSANYCHDRNCKPCAAARSATIARNLAKLMNEGTFAHVVLTLKHSDSSLGEQFGRLIECFAALRRQRLWSDRVKGGAYFFEVKPAKCGARLHPHLHIVIESSFLPQHELSAAWLKLTGDSSNVWIEAINNKQKATRYVAKYASKGLDPAIYESCAWLDCCLRALHGRRLCSTFGGWRGTQLEDESAPDVEWEFVGWLGRLIRDSKGGCVGSAAVIQNLLTARYGPQDPPGQTETRPSDAHES